MRRLLSLALMACPALAFAADPPDDRAKLQGVWHSPADAPVKARVIFLGDKAGYSVGDPGAEKPVPGSSFMALSDAKFGEEGGKKFVELVVSKDYKPRVDYRFDKDGLVMSINKKEYPLRRANTRADDPAAKKFAGAWKITALEVKGMKQEAGAMDVGSIAFTGDRYVWKGPNGKEFLNSYYRLGEPKDGRAELDIYGMKADPAIPMIVELKGDELTVAMPAKPTEKAARPKGFDTKAEETLVMRATRAK
jgi:uncharacterized protein (TIGR03067 family)